MAPLAPPLTRPLVLSKAKHCQAVLSKAKHWHAVMSEVPFKTSTRFKFHEIFLTKKKIEKKIKKMTNRFTKRHSLPRVESWECHRMALQKPFPNDFVLADFFLDTIRCVLFNVCVYSTCIVGLKKNRIKRPKLL